MTRRPSPPTGLRPSRDQQSGVYARAHVRARTLALERLALCAMCVCARGRSRACTRALTRRAQANKNRTADGGLAQVFTATNSGKMMEYSLTKQCPFDPETFFSMLEINYPVLLTPIMMVPEAFNRGLCIRPISNPQIGLDLIAIENKTKRNPQVGSMLLREYVCEIDQAHCRLDSVWQSPRAT